MQKLVWQNANGDILDLTKEPYGITNWEGFANTSLNIQSQQVPFQDGGVFLDALINSRELSVTLAICDGNDLEKRYQCRRELIHTLNPKLGEGYLIYTNDFISKRIKCVAQIPLFETHNSNDAGTPKASLSWTACEPYWEDLEEISVMSESGQRLVIENNGDIPCAIKARFLTYDGVINPSIKNLENERKIEINDTVNSEILINTNMGEKTVREGILKSDISVLDISKLFLYSERHNIIIATNALDNIYIGKPQKDRVKWEFVFKASGDVRKIIYVAEKNIYIGVTNARTIVKSSNGVQWTEIIFSEITNPYIYFYGVAYSNDLDLFVVCGGAMANNANVILTSSDAENWTQIEAPNTYNLRDVDYAENIHKFIIVGSNATVLESADGQDWEVITTNISNNDLGIVKYFKETETIIILGVRSGLDFYDYIHVGNDGETFTSYYCGDIQNIYYKDNYYYVVGGASQTGHLRGYFKKTRDFTNFISLITLDNKEKFGYMTFVDGYNYFVILGTYLYIGDENNYTNLGLMSDYSNITVYYLNDKYIYIVGGRTIFYKDTYTEITKYSNISGVNLRSICYSKKFDMYVMSSSNGKIVTTRNLIDFNISESGFDQDLTKIIYAEEKELFVAIYNGGIIISNDCVTWESVDVSTLGGTWFNDIAYDEYIHSFIIAEYRYFIKTTDFINFTSVLVTSNYQKLTQIAYNKKYILITKVVSGQFPNTVIYSQDNGENWEQIDFFGTEIISDIIYAENLAGFLVLCNNGNIYASVDCINWNTFLETQPSLQKIAYSSKEVCLFGKSGSAGFQFDFEETQNIINKLTQDSNLDFMLNIGENYISISSDNKVFNAIISYRQKYIGV